MNTIRWLKPDEMSRWDDFVHTHPLGCVYHLSAWKSVLENSFRHIKAHFVVLWDRQQERIVAGIPLYTVTSLLLGTRIITIPLATLCDPLVSTGEQLTALLPSAIRFAHRQKASSLQFKTFNSAGMFPTDEFQRITSFKHHFIPLEQPLDAIHAQCHPSCIQRSIRKARKHGITIRLGRGRIDLHRFYELFVQTRKHHGLPPVPYRLFANIDRFLGSDGKMRLFLAQRDGRIISGLMMLLFKDLAIIEYSADDNETRRIAPNQLLCWKAIEFAHTEGYRIFSFGRTYRHNKGLRTYKKRWGSVETDLPEFHHFQNDPGKAPKAKESSFSYRLIQRASGHLPTWSFKLLGDLMYRHLG